MGKQVEDKRYRKMFRFWLDAEKDDEAELSNYCATLKEKRSYAATIRDALRLIWSLREHKLDVLFALFPWINTWLEERAQAIAKSMLEGKTGGGDSGDSDIRAELQQIKDLLIHSYTPNGMLMAAKDELQQYNPHMLPLPKSTSKPKTLPEFTVIESARDDGSDTTAAMAAALDAF